MDPRPQVLPAGIAALRNIKQEDKDAIDAFLTQGVLGDTPATMRALAKERFTHGSPFDVKVDAITRDFILVAPDGRERFRCVLYKRFSPVVRFQHLIASSFN